MRAEEKKRLSFHEKAVIIIILILAIYGVFSISKEVGSSLNSLYYKIRTKLLYNKIIKVPDFNLINEKGKPIKLFSGERTYTIIFIGELGCNACLEELLSFPNYEEEFDSFQKYSNLLIAVVDSTKTIENFNKSNNFNFPMYTIDVKDVRYLTSFVPAIFIINNRTRYIEWHSIGVNKTFIQDIKNFLIADVSEERR